ncbi:MAG: hypothetical protein HY462_00400 [Parcubacteria group bacterium]|nr:hypothetical protein [Parcubacteria group bacterium]
MQSSNQVVLLKQMLERTEKQLATIKGMLAKLEQGEKIELTPTKPKIAPDAEGEVVEGVFDGVNMVGSDGKIYTVPANYASKSKLVEGDLLKLTIAEDGTFIYKQIGPVERKRVRSTLLQDDDTGEYSVLSQGHTYKVLAASITYYKGEVGDEVVVLVPVDKQSTWAAVENVIKHLSSHSVDQLDKATADLL